jgi:hypothetical protein
MPVPYVGAERLRSWDAFDCPHTEVWGFLDEYCICVECASTIGPTKKRDIAGAPLKFSAEAMERIIDGLRNGEMQSTAAAAAGVSPQTLNIWLSRKEPEYRGFQTRVIKARGECRARMERLISATDPKAWLKAVARRPIGEASEHTDDSWADKQEVTGTIKHAHLHAHVTAEEFDYSKLTDEELRVLDGAHARLALEAPKPPVNAIDAEIVDEDDVSTPSDD